MSVKLTLHVLAGAAGLGQDAFCFVDAQVGHEHEDKCSNEEDRISVVWPLDALASVGDPFGR